MLKTNMLTERKEQELQEVISQLHIRDDLRKEGFNYEEIEKFLDYLIDETKFFCIYESKCVIKDKCKRDTNECDFFWNYFVKGESK